MITFLTLYYICRVCSSYANHYILYLTYRPKCKTHMILSEEKKAFFKKNNATFLYDKSINRNRESTGEIAQRLGTLIALQKYMGSIPTVAMMRKNDDNITNSKLSPKIIHWKKL